MSPQIRKPGGSRALWLGGVALATVGGLLATQVIPAHATTIQATGTSRGNPPTAQATGDVWDSPDGKITITNHLSHGRRLEITRRPAPDSVGNEPLTTLPHYDPAGGPYETQIDLREQDLSSFDLAGRAQDLLHADFDTRTRWPRSLPAGFDPKAIMELGKNPGLGVRDLHRAGVTGKGVGIAIIDQTLLVDHSEYRDRLKSYEEIHVWMVGSKPQPASMHGAGVASIAVGRTTGVAPQADLYYIADDNLQPASTPDGFELEYRSVARSIDRILEINQRLPKASRIRVISCSMHWMPGTVGYDEVNAAVRRATKAGVFVLSVGLAETHNLRLDGLARDPNADPDLASVYRPGSGSFFNAEQQTYQPGTTLLAPMDSRTTAAVQGPDDYLYSAISGLSWSVPYLAGLYALACQVDPLMTPERFWALGLQTGTVVDIEYRGQPIRYGTIVAPAALIDAVRAAKTRRAR